MCFHKIEVCGHSPDETKLAISVSYQQPHAIWIMTPPNPMRNPFVHFKQQRLQSGQDNLELPTSHLQIKHQDKPFWLLVHLWKNIHVEFPTWSHACKFATIFITQFVWKIRVKAGVTFAYFLSTFSVHIGMDLSRAQFLDFIILQLVCWSNLHHYPLSVPTNVRLQTFMEEISYGIISN